MSRFSSSARLVEHTVMQPPHHSLPVEHDQIGIVWGRVE